MLETISPVTGQQLRVTSVMSPQEVAQKVLSSNEAFGAWRRLAIDTRATYIQKVAALLLDDKKRLGALITEEMGKPLAESVAEIEKCAWVCEYYANHAAEFLQDEMIPTDATKSYVAYQPLGVVLSIMPWNFPFWQVFRFVAPALMAGNTVLLKHASNVYGCAFAIKEVFEKIGLPESVFDVLAIKGADVLPIIDMPEIAAVTLTGSSGAGKQVAARAGAALKKVVLELGGSDPYIILEDADLEYAAEQCVKGRFINGGQSCVAAKRFIVVAAAYEDFVALLKERIANLQYGDPTDVANTIGPMASVALRDELHKQVQDSIAKGAQSVLGGGVPGGEGAFYPPTLLTDVEEGMPAYHEELFGPVASVIKVADEDEAMRVANDSDFGLGGAVFTADVERGELLARDQLESGVCFVNGFVRSDPRLPFGGVKQSGYGRELSVFGIREFTNIKTVFIAS